MATKLFGTETRSTFLPGPARELLGVNARAYGNDQGAAYVCATSKRAAADVLERAKVSGKSSLATERASGNALTAVLDANEGPGEGELIVLPLRGSSVLHYSDATGWTLVGRVTPAGFVSRARLDELSAAIGLAGEVATYDGLDVTLTDDQLAAIKLVLDAARDRLVQLRVAFGEA